MLEKQKYTRYKGQIAIPEIGNDCQDKLLQSKVLIIGLGGLGCPIAIQLAAAGIGTIGLVENDKIEITNLARQILYKENDIGRDKIDIAYHYLTTLNPNINIIKHQCFISEDNYFDIIKNYDLVIDGSDNFSTRYLINDACYLMKKPLVSGMVFRFEGRMIFFNFNDQNSPCLRCIHPSFNNQSQSCSVGGVTNMITGIIGSLQSNETFKYVAGIINSRDTFLIKYDSLNNEFKKIQLKKDTNCKLCGINKEIFEVKNMNIQCENNNYSELICSQKEFKKKIDSGKQIIILDVRTPEERIDDGVIPNDVHIQLDYLSQHYDQLDQNSEIIVYCRSGIRSLKATTILKDLGFQNVKSLDGGIKAFSRD